MTQLTPAQVAAVARQAGFKGTGLVYAVAVALAESGGRTDAVGVNKDGSRDRGLWQINDKWHPEVSDAQAFAPASAASAAFTISKGGTNWTPWVTAKSGAATKQLSTAQLAVNATPVATPAVSTTGTAGAQNVGWLGALLGGAAGTLIPGVGAGVGGLLGSQAEDGVGPGGTLADGAEALGGAVGEAAAGPVETLASIGDALQSIAKGWAIVVSTELSAAQWVANPKNWSRVALITLGGAGAVAGLIMIGQSGVEGPVGAAGRAVATAPGKAARATGKAVGAAGSLAVGAATGGTTLAAQGAAKGAAAAGKAAKAAKSVTK